MIFKKKKKHKAVEGSILVSICGAGDQKALMEVLPYRLRPVLNRNVCAFPSFGQLLFNHQQSIGQMISVEYMWSLEGECVDFEATNKDRVKVVGTTPIDRYAYSLLSAFDLDSYYTRVIPSFAKECTVLAYVPLKMTEDTDVFHVSWDKTIRDVLKQHNVPSQMVLGSVDQQCETIIDCLKLKLGL